MNFFRSHRDATHAFHRRKKRQSGVLFRRITMSGIILVLPLVLGGCLYFFFFSHVFALDYIDVAVQGSVDPSKVRSLLFQQMEGSRNIFLSQKNIFAFDPAQAERSIRDAFVVDSLSLKKIFPNKLHVSLSAKPFRALWYTGGMLYDVTTRGTIAGAVDSSRIPFFPKGIALLGPMEQNTSSTGVVAFTTSTPIKSVITAAPRINPHSKESESEQVPIIVDEKSEPVQQDVSVLSDAELTYILNLSHAVREQGIHYEYFSTSRNSITVQVVTNEGWRILTDNRGNPFSQSEMVSTVVREKIRTERKKMKYIDVRFGNRVYYKL